jgi:hypothetical protein
MIAEAEAPLSSGVTAWTEPKMLILHRTSKEAILEGVMLPYAN